MTDKKSIDDYVEQIVRGGYNMVRMTPRARYQRKWKTLKAFEWDPVMSDLDDYFQYKLKENGIYILYSLGDPGNYFDYCYPYGGAEKQGYDIFARPEDFERWCKNLKHVLEHKNKYTGIRNIDNPQIAFLDFGNELEWTFIQTNTPHKYSKFYREWLKKKYGTIRELKKVWDKDGVNIRDFEDIHFERLNNALPGPARIDLARFTYDFERSIYTKQKAYADSLGCRKLSSTYFTALTMRHAGIKKDFGFVAKNCYFDHPRADVYGIGTMHQSSSVKSAASIIRGCAATRLYGKPYLIGEHAQSFFNKYRHEHGMIMGAYLALNDYDAVNAFEMCSTINAYHRMVMFEVRFDPVCRAGEIMLQLLFRRKDVQTSNLKTRIALDMEDVFRNDVSNESISSIQLQAALLGQCYVDLTKDPAKNGEIIIQREGGSKSAYTSGDSSIVESKNTSFHFGRFVEQLKAKGLLPENNATKGDFFESSTGEIKLNAETGRMTIITPRFCGLSSMAGDTLFSPVFSVEKMNRDACMALASMDQAKNIPSSKRLLLFAVTNALNEGCVFENETQRHMLKKGGRKVLLQTGEFAVSFRNENASKLKVWAILPNGKRSEQLPLTVSGDKVHFKVNTEKLKVPTFCFEFAEK